MDRKRKFRFWRIKGSLTVLRNYLMSSSSHKKIALALTVGFYLGLFPVIGTTTILCVLASILFKLNPLVLQAFNILFSPFQILLIYPFIKAGRLILSTSEKSLETISVQKVIYPENNQIMDILFESLITSLTGWTVFTILSGYFVYRIFLKMNYSKIASILKAAA